MAKTLLKYVGDKKLTFTVTKCPLTNPQASPTPTGVALEELDEKAVDYRHKRDEILNHPNYTENDTITLKKGINEFDIPEQAEYLYKILGNPEVGGTVPFGVHQEKTIINKNVIFEVNEKGEEIRGEGSLFQKYRQPVGVQMYEVPSAAAYDEPEKKK